MKARRMVRNYADRPVPRHLVEEILDLARRAPSAGFSQGQRFVVVTTPEGRARIAALAGEPEYLAKGFPPWLTSAPVHIVLCADEEAYRARYAEPDKLGLDRWNVPYWHVDAGASMMVILLAAVERGLACGFLGEHGIPGLAQALRIPPHVQPVGVITLGYAAPDRPSQSLRRGRLPFESVVHWEQFIQSSQKDD